MKSLNAIQTLSKVGRVLCKIAFVFSVIGFCGCIAGIIGLSLAGGELIKIGGVTLHGLISEHLDIAVSSLAAALCGGMIVCAGEAVLAKFAEDYFEKELEAGTPFTHDGAAVMLRLGILTVALPIGCSVLASIVEGIVAGFMNADKAVLSDHFDNSANVALGVMFIVASLLCRYGAELAESGKRE